MVKISQKKSKKSKKLKRCAQENIVNEIQSDFKRTEWNYTDLRSLVSYGSLLNAINEKRNWLTLYMWVILVVATNFYQFPLLKNNPFLERD